MAGTLMERISQFWTWLTTSRYTRLLEQEKARLQEEVDRLKRENFAMMNSMLGLAGAAPIELDRDRKVPVTPPRAHSWNQRARELEAADYRAMRQKEAAAQDRSVNHASGN